MAGRRFGQERSARGAERDSSSGGAAAGRTVPPAAAAVQTAAVPAPPARTAMAAGPALAPYLLAAALSQAAAAPPADAPPAPADAAPAPAETDEHGTVTLPPTGGERRTADRADAAEAARLVTDLTNAFREENGLNAVTRDDTLAAAAAKFGRFLAERGVLGHEAGGTTPAQRVTAAGYEFCSVRENLAYQFDPFGFDAARLARETVDGWKNSPGHRANLLADDVTQTGVAVVYHPPTGRYFAVQLFALPQSAAVTFEVENRTAEAQTYRVAGRLFTLPPRFVRSHTRCSPGRVEVRLGKVPAAPTDKADPPADTGEPLTLAAGQVLILRPADGGGVEPDVWSPPPQDRDGPDDGPAADPLQ